MKNRKKSKAYETRREKLIKLMKNPDISENIKDKVIEKDLKLFFEIARENRLNNLFEDLNIDKNKLKKARKKVIKLSPNSKNYHLISHIFCNHKGQYHVDHLFNEYHDDIFRNGMIVGIEYGKKFIVKDIQENRITKEDLLNMNNDELYNYFYEEREEI